MRQCLSNTDVRFERSLKRNLWNHNEFDAAQEGNRSRPIGSNLQLSIFKGITLEECRIEHVSLQ